MDASIARTAGIAALAMSIGVVAGACGCGAKSWGGPGSLPSTATPDLSANALGATSSKGVAPPVLPASFATGVDVHLTRLAASTKVAFALPLPHGAAKDTTALRVHIAGQPVDARTSTLLPDRDGTGQVIGVRSAWVELPAASMSGESLDVHIDWSGSGATPATASIVYGDISFSSDEIIPTAERSIRRDGGAFSLEIKREAKRTLFTGREPKVLATFPQGYLAAIGLLGPESTASAAAGPSDAGLRVMSSSFEKFALSAMYDDGYPVDAFEMTSEGRAEEGSVRDPLKVYSAWLYDRCATFLIAYAHFGDVRFYRHALRTCANYADHIDDKGIFTGKPDADPKYSHSRGLFAYFALTGDPRARSAIESIEKLWENDPLIVKPYREGHTRAQDHLWTERLLGTSMEGLFYGFLLTGDAAPRTAFEEMLATAYHHVTERDPAKLQAITRTKLPFPPQGCFIHSAEQHGEGNAEQPWCSTWMAGLLVDPMLAWQSLTNDTRVDDILISLTRFLRDVGTAYDRDSDSKNDSFFKPAECKKIVRADEPRVLVPAYGAGIDAGGVRRITIEGDGGREHCADASGLTAAGIRALKRRGLFDLKVELGPFKTEGESFLALHEELIACSAEVFKGWSRIKRDPRSWKSADLAAGSSNPDRFLADNKIGWPSYPSSPMRKLSWWFNGSMSQWALLDDAGVNVPDLSLAGRIEPAGCH